MKLKTFLINWVIYFTFLSILGGIATLLTGGLIHGVVIVRVFVCMALAYLNPIYKE